MPPTLLPLPPPTASAQVENWDDELDESFVLPEKDMNPIRFASSSSSSSYRPTSVDNDADMSSFETDDEWASSLPSATSSSSRQPAKLFSPSSIGSSSSRITPATSKRTLISLPASFTVPAANAWMANDFGDVDMSGFDEDDDDRTSTLKAIDTVKVSNLQAALRGEVESLTPNGRSVAFPGSVKKLGIASTPRGKKQPPINPVDEEADDMEIGFSLPTTLNNLSLRPLRNQSSRVSITSTVSSNSSHPTPFNSVLWDTPSSNGSNSHEFSPFTPPSLTPSRPHSSSEPEVDLYSDVEQDDEGNSLDGLVLPESHPFSLPGSNNVLKSLISHSLQIRDKSLLQPSSDVRIVGSASEEDERNFEEGLVIDVDHASGVDGAGLSAVESVDSLLSRQRLERVTRANKEKARSRTLPASGAAREKLALQARAETGAGTYPGPSMSSSSSATANQIKKENQQKLNELERGWGRSKSPNPSSVLDSVRPDSAASQHFQGSVSSRPKPSQPRSQTQTLSLTTLQQYQLASQQQQSQPTPSLRSKKSLSRLATSPATFTNQQQNQQSPPSSSSSNSHSQFPTHAASILNRRPSLPHMGDDHSSPSSSSPPPVPAFPSRYAAPTTASLARSRERSGAAETMSAASNCRPMTPISSPGLLSPTGSTRLTAPLGGSIRSSKSRPSLASIFNQPGPNSSIQPSHVSNSTRSQSPALRNFVSPPPAGILRSNGTPVAHGTRSTRGETPLQRQPKRPRPYGDGTELDAFEDLEVDLGKEGLYRVEKSKKGVSPSISSSSVTKPTASSVSKSVASTSVSQVTIERRRKLQLGGDKMKPSAGTPTRERRRPGLIKAVHLETKAKVVGSMTYNPKTHTWEGNETALRAFDNLSASSSRPALITHLSTANTPTGSRSPTQTARIVGNMIFDPIKMCWTSRLTPTDEDFEPDPFEGMDDEDANEGGVMSESEAEKGEYMRRIAGGEHRIEDDFIRRCRLAEQGHRVEISGWALDSAIAFGTAHDRLFEIRNIALKPSS